MEEECFSKEIEESGNFPSSDKEALKEIADWALFSGEKVINYYKYERSGATEDQLKYWIATDNRLIDLDLNLVEKTGNYKTLFYKDQKVFIDQEFAWRGDDLTDAYPITMTWENGEEVFRPLTTDNQTTKEDEKQFINFITDVINELVNK